MIPLGALALLGSRALAGVTFEHDPAQGVETVVVVTAKDGAASRGETVRVVHRPGLHGEREVAVGITDARGRVRWTPEVGGVATLRAGESEQPVRVIPAEAPLQVAILLALLSAGALASLAWGLAPTGARMGR